MQGWDEVEPELRNRIDNGVAAIMRINRHEAFKDWLQVGEALNAMQTAAMRLAHTNQPVGPPYRAAWKTIAAQVPNLVNIHKTTRSHAVWMANQREAIEEWHAKL